MPWRARPVDSPIFDCSDRATRFSDLLRCFLVTRGKLQQAFATPDADDPHPLGIAPAHDAERRMDEFPQEGLIEFGYHSAQLGMVSQGLDALEDFRHQSRPDIWHPLLRVPGTYRLEIAERGFGETDDRPGHGAT